MNNEKKYQMQRGVKTPVNILKWFESDLRRIQVHLTQQLKNRKKTPCQMALREQQEKIFTC